MWLRGCVVMMVVDKRQLIYDYDQSVPNLLRAN